MDTFGSIIKEERIKQKLYLHHIAAMLNVDQVIISKIERGVRLASEEQVLKFAKVFELDKRKLLVEWLSDKMVHEIECTDFAFEVLQVAEKKIFYKKNKVIND